MLSDKLASLIRNAITDKTTADELITAIETGMAPQVDNVPVIGSTSNLTALAVTATSIAASNFTAADAADPTKAEIDAGINTLKTAVVTALDLKADNADVETLRTQIESRLDVIEGKIDELIGAMTDSEIMDS